MDKTHVFGAALRKIRKQKQLSQEDFGAELDLHRTHVSLLERGKRDPLFSTVLQIIDKLGMTPTEFMAIVEEEMKSHPEEG